MNVGITLASLLALVSVAALPPAAAAQEPGHGHHAAAEHPAASEVIRTVEAYHAALASGDGESALALLTDDAIILESGGLETKAQYADHHLPGDIAFAQAVDRSRGDIQVSGTDDVAWAWSTSETTGSYRDRQIDARGAELMVLVATSDGWRISAIHWSSRAR